MVGHTRSDKQALLLICLFVWGSLYLFLIFVSVFVSMEIVYYFLSLSLFFFFKHF